MAQLTETINATLERLEQAVENQRRFASDASHELRTPLTRLLTRLLTNLLTNADRHAMARIRRV